MAQFNGLLELLGDALDDLGLEVYDDEPEDDDVAVWIVDEDGYDVALVLSLMAIQPVEVGCD